jgi:hypothetical protein
MQGKHFQSGLMGESNSGAYLNILYCRCHTQLKNQRINACKGQTLQSVASVMNEKKKFNIDIRLTLGPSLKFGSWTTEDYEVFLNFIFNDAKSNPEDVNYVEYIQNLPLSVIYESAKILNRHPQNVLSRWYQIKPTLLSYHKGSLQMDIKAEFFKYIVEMKVHATQDIDWPNVIKLFPGQNPRSLHNMFRYIGQFSGKIPLYEALKTYLKNDHQTRQSALNRRQHIIILYNKARGISSQVQVYFLRNVSSSKSCG